MRICTDISSVCMAKNNTVTLKSRTIFIRQNSYYRYTNNICLFLFLMNSYSIFYMLTLLSLKFGQYLCNRHFWGASAFEKE